MMADARIDLHTHSHWSDGDASVEKLLACAREAQLDAIALTDHDTTAGWAEARQAAAATGVSVIPGIEVSAEHGHRSVHILALLVDPSPQTELSRMLAQARHSRDERARLMTERIAADYPIDWQSVRAQVHDSVTTVGRPHIADALVAAGVVASRDEAFAHILHASGPYYEPYRAPAPAEVVAAIGHAGGVAIAAHPGSLTRGEALSAAELEQMVEAGLRGIEVDHREHDAATRERLRRFAQRHGLLITGGSDYHGAGKPNQLGENLTDADTVAELVSRATSSTEVFAA